MIWCNSLKVLFGAKRTSDVTLMIVSAQADTTEPAVVLELGRETGHREIVLSAMPTEGVEGALSVRRPMAFPSAKDRTGYGFFYPPRADV